MLWASKCIFETIQFADIVFIRSLGINQPWHKLGLVLRPVDANLIGIAESLENSIYSDR